MTGHTSPRPLRLTEDCSTIECRHLLGGATDVSPSAPESGLRRSERPLPRGACVRMSYAQRPQMPLRNIAVASVIPSGKATPPELEVNLLLADYAPTIDTGGGRRANLPYPPE